MKEELPPYQAIIFLQVTAVANTSEQKLGNSRVTLYLRRARQPPTSRVQLLSRQCAMQHQREELEAVGLTLCRREDCIEIELQELGGSKTSAYSKISLDKLIELPSVKHQVQCLLVEKNWDRFFEGPLRNIAQLNLSLICFPSINGKLIIPSIEITLSRSSSSAVVQLQGQQKRVERKGGDQKSWLWSEETEFDVTDLNKSLQLQVAIYNQQGACVGSQSVDLIQELMLIPEQSPSAKQLKILSPNKQSIGTVQIQYHFIISPP